MHLLAIKDICSGGSCPAVYDSDEDLRGDELAVVGTTVPGITARLADRIAPHEAAVVISRSIVAAALRPEPRPITMQEFEALFETFSYSAFRLETLQHYAGTTRDDQWIAHLKACRRWGKTHQRVHVVTEPLTPAMQQELTEGYEGNVAAGEDIRIIPVADRGEWPKGLECPDFWLFDSSRLYVMRYEPDGDFAGADLITDPESIVKACRVRDQALHDAVPWHAYIAEHPHLRRLVAQ